MKNTQSKPRRPKRRRFQFGLKTLLVAVLLLALPLSWLAVKLQRARAQHAAVLAVKNLNGTVYYDFQFDESVEYYVPFDRGTMNAGYRFPGMNLHAPPPGPAWVHDLFGTDFATSVVSVRLTRSHIRDEDLARLRGFPDLHALSLNDTQITDDGLLHLKGLTKLRDLDLRGTKITDEALRHLAEVTSLEAIKLDYTDVTDAGLAHLGQLKTLRWLSLLETDISDEGLLHLKGLKNLKLLAVGYYPADAPSVTADGVKKLKRALPELKVFPYDDLE